MHHVFTKFDDINDVGMAQHVFSQHWVAYDAIFAYEGVFVLELLRESRDRIWINSIRKSRIV